MANGMNRAGWTLPGSTVLMSVAVLLATVAGCSDTVEEPAEPAVAAMFHPSIAKVGQKVRFDASRSWTDKDAAKEAREGATLVRYTFLVADGTPETNTAASFYDHVFSKAGTYAVQLTATDDLGRITIARSTIAIAADYSPACDANTAKSCASGQCDGDRCAVLACAGDAACSTGTTAGLRCVEGMCKVSSSP